MTSIALNDPLLGGAIAGCAAASLSPGASISCSGSYATVQADVDTGSVSNTASATGTPPSGPAVTASDSIIVELTDDEIIKDGFRVVTGHFINTRMDRLLSNSPERNRLRLRGANGEDDPGLRMNVQGTGADVHGEIALSSSGIRGSLYELSSKGYSPALLRKSQYTDRSGFEVWGELQFALHDDSSGTGTRQGSFGIGFLGADYRFTDNLIVGLLVEADWAEEETDLFDANSSGFGWMTGPYLSAELAQDMYFDVRAQWGRSENEVFSTINGNQYAGRFGTERWLAEATLTGTWRNGPLKIHPEARVAYVREHQDDYRVSDGARTIDVSGRKYSLGRLSVGPEIAYTLAAGDWELEPFTRLKLLWDFGRSEEADTGSIGLSADDLRGSVAFGLRAKSNDLAAIDFQVEYDGINTSDFEAVSAKASAIVPF